MNLLPFARFFKKDAPVIVKTMETPDGRLYRVCGAARGDHGAEAEALRTEQWLKRKRLTYERWLYGKGRLRLTA